ncbi:ATP-binding protein [Streptomyces sp. bgisy060]|uniref:ATP-binding protein n=1 Tax=Streptomyces sp. bgisy060 TaxID=3413775 RepID=UPI003EB9B893
MSLAPALGTAAVELTKFARAAFEIRMPAQPDRVAQARKTTAAHLARWGVPLALADDVVLVVSELVTNAIEHGQGDVVLRVERRRAHLYVGVADGSPVRAAIRPTNEEDPGGRGLVLVDALSAGWGTTEDGQLTWAHVTNSGGRA